MTTSYDLMVLGAGPGGYVAAIRASQLGMRVALVESGQWGGVCLNVGCIPSKALLRNAEVVRLVSERERFGIYVPGPPRFDYAAAYRRSREVVAGRVRGLQYLLRKNRIDTFDGLGTFTDERTLTVTRPGGESQRLGFSHAVLAVGATPRLLPGTRLGPRVHSFREAVSRETAPPSLLIIGGGAIGVELAYVFSAYETDVTIVEAEAQLLPTEDRDVAAELARQYRRLGIELALRTRVTALIEGADAVRISLDGATGAQERDVDCVLQAIGFRPRTEGYGLENTGVALTPGGAVAVDAYGRTSQPHIFAIGDVTGKLMLAHVAEAMGMVAAEVLAGHDCRAVDFAHAPRAVYGHPQVASFGPTESEARAAGLDLVSFTFPMQANGKAQALGQPLGFAKLLAHRSSGRLEAAHLVGPDVTELLPALTLAQQAELTVDDIAHNIHAHPTLSETVKDAAYGVLGRPVNV